MVLYSRGIIAKRRSVKQNKQFETQLFSNNRKKSLPVCERGFCGASWTSYVAAALIALIPVNWQQEHGAWYK
jgi:hypothetical protein